jgi:glycosyltransferase involved in cell wall biosynthesis
MKKIKVLHLTSTRYGIGGVERLLLDMSDKHDLSRFEFAYCNLFCDAGGNGVFPSELKKRGLEYITVSGRGWKQLPKIISELARVIRRAEFDILHLHMLQATIVGGLSSFTQNRTKTVVTKHYTDALLGKRSFSKRADLYFTNRADGVIAISDYVRNDLLHLGINGSKVVRVHNGIDLQRFDKLRSESCDYQLPDGKRLIGSVGSLTKRKGHRFLIEAMPRILAAFPDTYLLIVGEGPEDKNLKEQIDRLQLADHVSIAGFVPNVAPILEKLDLYVHPSINEPFGVAVLEAMAASKCVVATGVEGIPEIVSDGETGRLVQAGDNAELAKCIVTVLSDPELNKTMGKAGRRRVEELFSLGRTVRGYEEVYGNVAGRINF